MHCVNFLQTWAVTSDYYYKNFWILPKIEVLVCVSALVEYLLSTLLLQVRIIEGCVSPIRIK